ncbi:hypothetical protein NDI56_17015 [Haloarcula sp. S1CR25-12]|uniref:Uncharacterized protein n=1 Tax=Haloarcula saliterrae TaxID=2950534 RepID=A0ABU2FFR5_9EURY|nr:rod-determining factor RdfA [Haloarcula sp. S1CR25-12]MDS0261102.1 hypothetical protein [Haloarcula sp. S1CR25-12]
MDHCCKVGRLSGEYALKHGVEGRRFDRYLADRWLGRRDYTATGLRPLSKALNHKLLKTVYNEHGRNALETRVESDYEVLADGDESSALLDDLDSDGIDGRKLQREFVSSTTLYRHFTDCLGESKSNESGTGDGESDWESDKVDHAREVLRRNVSQSLRSLANKGRLPEADTAQIKTEVILGCPECATQVSFRRAVDRGYICAEHMSTADAGTEPKTTD